MKRREPTDWRLGSLQQLNHSHISFVFVTEGTVMLEFNPVCSRWFHLIHLQGGLIPTSWPILETKFMLSKVLANDQQDAVYVCVKCVRKRKTCIDYRSSEVKNHAKNTRALWICHQMHLRLCSAMLRLEVKFHSSALEYFQSAPKNSFVYGQCWWFCLDG